MDYVGQIIRPPSEAHSIILQVTTGCSHNKCTFCGAYKEKRFSIKDDRIILEDLDFASTYCRNQNKVFLADGDVLTVPFNRLEQIFLSVREHLPWVRRISLYGNARSVIRKTRAELIRLKQLGLDRIYLGLESGDDDILNQVKKGETSATMIEAAQKAGEAGIFLSVTVLLGLGQYEHSKRHARKTAEVLNRMNPQQIAALTLMPLDNTELGQHCLQGRFKLPDPITIVEELRLLIEHLDCKAQIHANHASNFMPIVGRLPKHKARLLQELDEAIKGQRQLVPDNMRSL